MLGGGAQLAKLGNSVIQCIRGEVHLGVFILRPCGPDIRRKLYAELLQMRSAAGCGEECLVVCHFPEYPARIVELNVVHPSFVMITFVVEATLKMQTESRVEFCP
jgi:hypothetical protein